jgi:hypothetical protein
MSQTRCLTVILAADVAGYSRPMGSRSSRSTARSASAPFDPLIDLAYIGLAYAHFAAGRFEETVGGGGGGSGWQHPQCDALWHRAPRKRGTFRAQPRCPLEKRTLRWRKPGAGRWSPLRKGTGYPPR